MLIKWNENRLKVVDESSFPVDVFIKYKEEGWFKNSTLIILPGINEIPDDLWKALKEHFSIKQEIKYGLLEELKIKTKDGTVSNFKNLSNTDKLEVISDTGNIDILTKWKEFSNDEIRYQIDLRITEIKNYTADPNIAKPVNHV